MTSEFPRQCGWSLFCVLQITLVFTSSATRTQHLDCDHISTRRHVENFKKATKYLLQNFYHSSVLAFLNWYAVGCTQRTCFSETVIPEPHLPRKNKKIRLNQSKKYSIFSSETKVIYFLPMPTDCFEKVQLFTWDFISCTLSLICRPWWNTRVEYANATDFQVRALWKHAGRKCQFFITSAPD